MQNVAPVFDVVPVAHGWHDVAPAVEENVPSGHSWHISVPFMELNDPAGHAVHGVSPLLLYIPGAHGVEAFSVPVQPVAPAGEVVPGGQAVHGAIPFTPYVPGAQTVFVGMVHVGEPGADEVPVGHLRQKFIPGTGLYIPCAQGAQAREPAVDDVIPGAHGVQHDAPSAENVPAGQTLHCIDAAVPEYIPATHDVHGANPVELYEPGKHGVCGAADCAFAVNAVARTTKPRRRARQCRMNAPL